MHRRGKGPVAAALTATAAVLLCVAGPAGAATRYVAPGGSNKAVAEPCPKRDPCGLRRGIENGRRIDDVVVASGPYTVSSEVEAPPGLDIRASGRSRPRLAGDTDFGTATLAIGNGSRVSGLRISQSGDDAAAIRADLDAVVENVQLVASGDRATGADLVFDAVLRDSTVWTTGGQSIGVDIPFSASGSPIRNATVIAQGPDSVGIQAGATSFPPPGAGGLEGRASVVNTVVRGTTADLQVRGDLQASGSINVSYSNFVTVGQLGGFLTEGAGNQSAAPLFAAPARNNFHQLPGSPTVDAGSVDPANGRRDPDGDPRLLGAAPDIGADELVPAAGGSPPPPPPPPPDPDAEPVDRKKPVISRLSITRRRLAPSRRGTAFRLRLSEDAQVSIRVQRILRGRRVGGRCVRRRSNMAHRRRCRRLKHTGTLRSAGRQGANRIRFSGRFGRRVLRPGRYRASVRARDAAGNLSRARRVRFRVVRPR